MLSTLGQLENWIVENTRKKSFQSVQVTVLIICFEVQAFSSVFVCTFKLYSESIQLTILMSVNRIYVPYFIQRLTTVLYLYISVFQCFKFLSFLRKANSEKRLERTKCRELLKNYNMINYDACSLNLFVRGMAASLKIILLFSPVTAFLCTF